MREHKQGRTIWDVLPDTARVLNEDGGCGCGPPETITDRDRANMRLAVRAPELLDYCREMVAVVEGQPRRNPFVVTEEMKALIAEIDGYAHE